MIYPEAGNILWKKQRLKELTHSEAEEITDDILSLPLKIEASKSLLPFALDIAIPYGMTVYDASYLSLAQVYETTLITAHRKIVDVRASAGAAEDIIPGGRRWREITQS